MAVGERRSCAFWARPRPESPTGNTPLSVEAVSVPAVTSAAVGLKATGTLSVSPVCSVAGSGGVLVPTANCDGVADSDVTVTWLVAVNVAVPVDVDPTTVLGNWTPAPFSAEVEGRPKASTWPSRVPT